jgi:hypothetical protein
MNQSSGPQELVRSYLSLRKAVGIIGFLLPAVLAIGKVLLQGPGIQCSISDYYYTVVRNVFVGALCTIGVFLMSTRGYDRRDEIAGLLGSVFAIGVALFPTTPRAGATTAQPCAVHVATTQAKIIGGVHLTFAALLFLTFAYFCLKLFTLDGGNPTRQKRKRNAVYRVCGYTILACIALIAIVHIPSIRDALTALTPVFWLETIAVMTFGLAWLTKGEMILKDEEQVAAAISR